MKPVWFKIPVMSGHSRLTFVLMMLLYQVFCLFCFGFHFSRYLFVYA